MVPLSNLSDVLSSPAWTVTATLLAGIAIVVTIVLFRRQRSRKELSYAMEITELVDVHSEAKDRIKIFFEDALIEQADLLRLRLENSGNVPIRKEDFQRPFVLSLDGDGTTLTVDIASTRPKDLNPQVQVIDGDVQLQPLLLNPADSVSLAVFVRNFSGFSFSYRIVDVSVLVDAAPEKPETSVLDLLLKHGVPMTPGAFSRLIVELLAQRRQAAQERESK